ncbi:MAG: dethiobiotin synthase [Holosporaceae bacterium]|jgi:dethiobiotin synthase|nr:dethiobiotin synthase [Holosporaceae bacterium]
MRSLHRVIFLARTRKNAAQDRSVVHLHDDPSSGSDEVDCKKRPLCSCNNIFVTGTDTDVGKTVVSAWICMHSRSSYWKPIQTGNDSDGDAVTKLSPSTKIIAEAYKLVAPLSPYDAAKLEKIDIDRNAFSVNLENTVIEGAGGVLVPIAKNFLMADLIKICNAKVVIVAKSKLGMINHLLMTAEVLKARGVDILGFVINGEIDDNLRRTIEEFSKLKILAIVPYGGNLIKTLQDTPVPSEILGILK